MSGLTFVDSKFELHKRGGQTVNYQAARQDTSGTPQYYAWLANDNSYIIMEQNNADDSNTTIKYFRATAETEAFQTAWNARAAKTYVEYSALFV